MTELFLEVLNRSINAGYLVLLIMLLRLVFRKMPKWVSVGLWGIAAVRLVCPVSLKSPVSLIPNPQTVSPDIMLSPAPAINSGLAAVNQAVNPVIEASFAPALGASANPLQIWIPVFAWVWVAGMGIMALYTMISYWKLSRRVSTAVKVSEGVYESEAVVSPFILGIFRPRIYLPPGLSARELVLAHERTHLRRKDHWWKPLGFLLLTFSWFHPLMWAAYVLFCRDVEMACDEAAVKNMEPTARADYSQALLMQSVRRTTVAACPLAFGEAGVKTRVKNVLNYRKPAFWVTVLSIALCVCVGVLFLTDPVEGEGLQTLRSLQEAEVWAITHQAFNSEFPAGSGDRYGPVTFYRPEFHNMSRIFPILARAEGTPIREPLGAKYNDDPQFIVIAFHKESGEGGLLTMEIRGSKYLVINDQWYETDPNWIASLPDSRSDRDALLRLDEKDISRIEMTDYRRENVITITYGAEMLGFFQAIDWQQPVAVGLPDIPLEVQLEYRILCRDGTEHTLKICGENLMMDGSYLMMDGILYHGAESWMEMLTKAA